MADYPSALEFDIVLKDGGTARLRPIKPTDAAALDDMFQRLSAEAVYHRFFRAKTRLTSEELECFTNVDYEDRNAFVVLHGLRRGHAVVGQCQRMFLQSQRDLPAPRPKTPGYT